MAKDDLLQPRLDTILVPFRHYRALQDGAVRRHQAMEAAGPAVAVHVHDVLVIVGLALGHVLCKFEGASHGLASSVALLHSHRKSVCILRRNCSRPHYLRRTVQVVQRTERQSSGR